MNSTLRVRACRATGELEIEGSPELVAEWWERLAPEITNPPIHFVRPAAAALAAPVVGATIEPEVSFGEFLHNYDSEISDTDRMMIAGFFIQSTSTDNAFSTRAANDLLLAQGHRV